MTLINLVTAVESLKALISFTVEISVPSDVSEQTNKQGNVSRTHKALPLVLHVSHHLLVMFEKV